MFAINSDECLQGIGPKHVRYDIDRLQTFYASPLGACAHRMIGSRLQALWPSLKGMDVLGFGHADLLLDAYPDCRRRIAASPDSQGAVPWPDEGKSSAVLVEEDRLPFIDAIFDRVIVHHGLEECESPPRLLREIWRVAAPEARILIIVAHRRGLWARTESTPFGQGRPYSRTQLYGLLEDSMFEPTAFARALYGPPLAIGSWVAGGDIWEGVGRTLWSQFGGVLMVEAVKRVVAEPRRPVRSVVKREAKAQRRIPAGIGPVDNRRD